MIYPLPAVLVSCGSTPEEYNILTVAWTGTICTNPPMCYISVRPERHSYDIIKRNMEFVINLTTKDMARATDWCGVRSGKNYNKFEEMKLPAGWGIEQHITCVDASTFQVYMQNMKSIFMDMVRNADMVVFNRSKKEYPLANFRRSIKVVNPSAEVIFEDEEGEMTDIFADQMPFDLDAEIVDIPPEDYGIWFVDAMDHPDRYVGKTLRFKARARRPRGMGSKFFIPGRTAMTCCADDTSFLGYICKSAYAPKLKPGEWVEVTAKVAFENRSEYQGEGIVLYAENVTPCEPLADEMVYFN